MKLNKSIVLTGTALAGTAFSGLFVGHAMAQSTASQTVTEVIIKGGPRSTNGLGVQTTQPKDQSIVNQDYMSTQVGSQNLAQAINLVPGVSYSTEDPTGVLSNDFRMHGFDGNHVSFTVDGTPLNDTGNYAIFPGEYSVSESLERITVDTGQTEVDSPTASSIGGTVNLVSRVPSVKPGAMVKVTGGSYSYGRQYAEIETGAIGPTGVRMYLSVNNVTADKYKGAGVIKRFGYDGRIYQPIGDRDFISASFTMAHNRPIFYFSGSADQIAKFGWNFDYNTSWAVPTQTPGAVDTVPPATAVAGDPSFQAGGESNYWALHPNPVDFANLRGQSKFHFGDKLTVTFDPFLFYTLANGGGASSVSEKDTRLLGSAKAFATCAKGGAGVDLNFDGDCLDTVLLYSASETQTHRWGVNSSLIYDFNDHNRLQVAYTYDNGRHRQTGEFTYIDQQSGQPDNVFGGKPGYGRGIFAADGAQLNARNRKSIAKLNQLALNYVGRFMDDKLHVNIGFRDPHFERDLDQRCYTFNGSTVTCNSIDPSIVKTALDKDNTGTHAPGSTATNVSVALFGAGSTTIKYGVNNLVNFKMPFKQVYKYEKALPNLGASYNFDEHSQVYATYAKGFSAPRTDNLYVSATTELVQPETTDQYGAGFRFKNTAVNFSVNLWAADWKNHIVSTPDPLDPTLSIDRNVGEVKLSGLDLEGGWRATQHLNIYASAAFTHSELAQDYAIAFTPPPVGGVAQPLTTTPLPVKGKELVLTPDQTYAIRATYTIGDMYFALQSKYTGRRYLTDVNDAQLKPNIVTDFDASVPIVGKDVTLSFNIYNLFNEKYYVRASTSQNVLDVVTPAGTIAKATAATSAPFYSVAAPITGYVTLKAKF